MMISVLSTLVLTFPAFIVIVSMLIVLGDTIQLINRRLFIASTPFYVKTIHHISYVMDGYKLEGRRLVP